MEKSYKNFTEKLNTAREAMKPVQFADFRENLIIQGLQEIAAECGVTLRKPMRIDSLGEIMIVATLPGSDACGQFGDQFAAILNKYPVRTGTVFMTGHVMPTGGWLKINHFDAEKLVANFK